MHAGGATGLPARRAQRFSCSAHAGPHRGQAKHEDINIG